MQQLRLLCVLEASKKLPAAQGWWYAARSIADGTNTGRRIMSGNIGTDVTHGAQSVGGHVPGAGGIRMFTSLPREVELADDGLTVHVKPPRELSGLRSGAAKATPLAAFKCGQQTSLGADVVTGEFEVMLDVADIQQVGTRSLADDPSCRH